MPEPLTRHIVALAIAATGATTARAEPMGRLRDLVAVKEVTATSTFADKRDAYAAWRTLAYDERDDEEQLSTILWSAWCEGKKDAGLGETLTITLAEPTQIDVVRVAAGVQRTAKLYKANNQITSLVVITDGNAQTIKPAGRDWTEVKIGAKVTTLAFKIDKIKKGKMNDSCLSAIDLVRGDERLMPVIGVDAKALAAMQPAIDAIQRALEKEDRAGLAKLVAFPFSNANADMDMGYGGSEAIVSNNAKELAAACKALAAAQEDSDGDPVNSGCPQPVNVRPDDERVPRVDTLVPGTVQLTWPSGREVRVTWRLRFTDRWRLDEIGVR